VKARAYLRLVKLRPRNGAYKVDWSHCCLLWQATLVRARSVFAHRALPAGLLLGLFLLLVLVSAVPTVLDLRQEFPNSFNVLLTPGMHFQIAKLEGLWRRHFLPRDIATQSPWVEAQFFGRLAC
jgi:hypothetical protein